MYGVSTKVSTGFDETVDRVFAALKTEGFGVLCDIDVAATLKAKLGVEHPRYRILGACNPNFAYQALLAEPEIGVLLPCNVVVREDDAGDIFVLFANPLAVLDLVENPKVPGVAAQITERLERAMEAIKG